MCEYGYTATASTIICTWHLNTCMSVTTKNTRRANYYDLQIYINEYRHSELVSANVSHIEHRSSHYTLSRHLGIQPRLPHHWACIRLCRKSHWVLVTVIDKEHLSPPPKRLFVWVLLNNVREPRMSYWSSVRVYHTEQTSQLVVTLSSFPHDKYWLRLR